MNPAVACGLDVMLHVTDEQGFLRLKFVIRDDLVNFLPLVPDAEVGLFQKVPESARPMLHVNDPAAPVLNRNVRRRVRATKLDELRRVRQRANRTLHLLEPRMKPRLELWERDVRRVLFGRTT